MSKNCPICKKKGKKIRNKVRGSYKISIFSCNKCDLHFSDIYNKPKEVIKFSQNTEYIYKKTKRRSNKCKFDEYEYRINKIKRIKFNNRKNILDIGCGDGGILNSIKNKNNNIYGIEINSSHIKNLKKSKIPFGNIDILNFFPEKNLI